MSQSQEVHRAILVSLLSGMVELLKSNSNDWKSYDKLKEGIEREEAILKALTKEY